MTAATDSLQVRDATRDDIAKIAQWNTDMALETENLVLDPDTITAGVTALFDHPERGFYLVAMLDGEACGSLMMTREWSDWRNGEFWWVQSVYVAPHMRRRGIYTALYAEVRRRAPDNVCGFRLYVEENNSRAQATYQRLGMHETHYRLYEQI